MSLKIAFQEFTLPSFSFGLINSLVKSGIKIDLYTGNFRWSLNKNSNIKNIFTPMTKSWAYPWFNFNLKLSKPDILHINLSQYASHFLKANKKLKSPLIYTNHFAPISEPAPELVPEIEKLYYEKEKFALKVVADNSFKVTSGSEYARDVLKNEFDVDSEVIYHGVDFSQYNRDVSPVEKKLLDIPEDFQVVLWVSRFGHHPYKDPFTFVRAIPLVLKKHPKTKFVMIGRGALKQPTITLAKKLNVEGALIFIDRVENLNHFYALSSIFVMSSYNDTFGNVVAEAMACGNAVIVSNHGSPKEVIGDAGLVFEYGSDSSLADKLITLLDDSDFLLKMSSKAHQRVQNFTWEKAASKYIKLYQQALDQNQF